MVEISVTVSSVVVLWEEVVFYVAEQVHIIVQLQDVSTVNGTVGNVNDIGILDRLLLLWIDM